MNQDCDYYKPTRTFANSLATVPRAVAIGLSSPKNLYSTVSYIDGRTDTAAQTTTNNGATGSTWTRCWSGQLYTASSQSASVLTASSSVCPSQTFVGTDPGNTVGSMGVCQIGSTSGDLHLLQVRAKEATTGAGTIFTWPVDNANTYRYIPEVRTSFYSSSSYWPASIGAVGAQAPSSTVPSGTGGAVPLTSTLRGCAGFTPSVMGAIAASTYLFWVDRGATGGNALQRSMYSATWSASIPVWPNAAHSNSRLFVGGSLVAAPASIATFTNAVVAATMDTTAQLFVVTGGVTSTSAVYASVNGRSDVGTAPIDFYQVLVLGQGSAGGAEFLGSVYRGVAMAPLQCSFANNDFRRELEEAKEEQ